MQDQNSSQEVEEASQKCSRVLIVTPSSEAAMHVSGGVAKVNNKNIGDKVFR